MRRRPATAGGLDGPELQTFRARCSRSDPSFADSSAGILQQSAQDGAMAPRLVLAIAAHREVRMLRQRRQQLDRAGVLRLLHLGPVAPRERGPFLLAGAAEVGLR